MSKLHWSVDYSYDSPLTAKKTQRYFRGEFAQILAGALSSSPVASDAATKTHRYALLPNFWSGFKRECPEDPSLNIGHASIERKRDDEGVWRYTIEHENTSSGEELILNFSCDNLPARPLGDAWKIRTHNSADGSYSSLSLTGACNDQPDGDREITVTTVSGLDISAGTVNGDETLTCNWALFDILPSLSKRDSLDHLAILEDLEILKNDCRIRPLEDWVFEISKDRHTFSGFCVFGTGFPPTYWWLTENGEVAVMATMLATYVLKERSE